MTTKHPGLLPLIHRTSSPKSNGRQQGLYYIRGAGAKRRVPNFDDLVFLGASVSRYPLEGYRERCDTNVTIGARYASKPLELDIPITIAGMSFGALGANAKQALGLGASAMGTSTTTGDGGMTDEEREASSRSSCTNIYHRATAWSHNSFAVPMRSGVIGRGAKPGGGGMLLGQRSLTGWLPCEPSRWHRPAQSLSSPGLDRS